MNEYSKKQAERQDRNIAKGICRSCGVGKLSSKTYCGDCLARRRTSVKIKRSSWRSLNLCTKCGKPPKTKTRCQKCLDSQKIYDTKIRMILKYFKMDPITDEELYER